MGVLKNHEETALFGGNGKMTLSRNVKKMAVFGENEKTAVIGGDGDIGVFEDSGKISAELKRQTRMEDTFGRGKERRGGRMEGVRGVGGKGVKGGGVRGAKEDDVIIFVQLSDIHLDQQYSEVLYMITSLHHTVSPRIVHRLL